MAYESVDKLQKVLQENIFHYAKDSKKAAGRALGTMVEIITFYLLKSWELNDSISIERGVGEYGNPEITHNVEYSLHPVMETYEVHIKNDGTSISSNKVLKILTQNGIDLKSFTSKSSYLLSKELTLRNACTIAVSEKSFLLCSFDNQVDNDFILRVYEQKKKAYAIFECKRVGIEEGMKKGPQTIEKAKQGAYVAKTISSLQKVRDEAGVMQGLIYRSDGTIISKPYTELMEEVIYSNDVELLRRFILTVGIVSNHGNWFTADNQNKEMKVLAQSYDWLLFLTDNGLSHFIEKLLLNPILEHEVIKEAFHASYTAEKKKNQFTKVQMSLKADKMLLRFFRENLAEIEGWFNVISPSGKTIDTLKLELHELKNKNWEQILK
ncbi:MAG TPA: hypothetical protein VGC97_22245 [Pyrinomonadaceae bacterium]|jgi:hypothetical protein